MNEKCPNCSSKFEKEPGFFIGAMYVSYGLVVFEGILTYVITRLFTSNPTILISVILSAIVVLSIPNYRFSRILWIHMFSKL